MSSEFLQLKLAKKIILKTLLKLITFFVFKEYTIKMLDTDKTRTSNIASISIDLPIFLINRNSKKINTINNAIFITFARRAMMIDLTFF